MERIIMAVFSIAVFVLLLVGIGLADTQVILNPTQDTYVNINHTMSRTNLSDTNHSEETVINLGKGIGGNNVCEGSGHCGFWLFNMTSAHSKIIRPTGSVLWNWTKESGYTASQGGYTRLSILANNSWNGSFVNGTGQTYYPNVSMNMTYIFGGVHDIDLHTFEPSKNFTLTPTVLGYLYNSTTLTIASDGYRQVGSDIYTRVYSIEDGSNRGVKLTFFNLTDYISGAVSITDLTGICFDFESGSYYDNGTAWNDCTTNLPEWDFFYDLTNNEITPKDTMAFYFRDGIATNESLGTIDCNTVGSYSYYNKYTNVNPPPFTPKLYDMMCFNQSYVHAVKGFYGAIKVINNSNVRYSLECPLNDCRDIDFYWSMYSPDFATFSLPYLIPNPPIAGVNLSIRWTTTLEMLGRVSFRINSTGNYSSYYTIEDMNKTYRTAHEVIIPRTYMEFGYYEYYLEGNNTAGTDYTSTAYNFSTVGNRTTWINENSTVPNVMQGLVDNGFVPDINTAYLLIGIMIVSAFSIFFMIISNSPKLGFLSFVTLLIAWSFANFIPSSWILIVIVIAAISIAKMVSKFWE